MKRGRKAGRIEKAIGTEAYTPEALIGGRTPEELNFAKLVFGLAEEKPRTAENWPTGLLKAEAKKRGVTVLAFRDALVRTERRRFEMFTELRRQNILQRLVDVAGKGDANAAKFLAAVANLVSKGAHRDPVADLPRMMLKSLTCEEIEYNATTVRKELKSFYGITMSDRTLRTELKVLGRKTGVRGRPKSGN